MRLGRVSAPSTSSGSPVRAKRRELGLSLRQCARLLGMDVIKLGEVERGLALLTKEQRDKLDRARREESHE